MLDYLGKEINVGDAVVFTAPGYRCLTEGKIISITPKKVRIWYLNTWNYSNGKESTYLSEPDFVIVIRSRGDHICGYCGQKYSVEMPIFYFNKHVSACDHNPKNRSCYTCSKEFDCIKKKRSHGNYVYGCGNLWEGNKC